LSKKKNRVKKKTDAGPIDKTEETKSTKIESSGERISSPRLSRLEGGRETVAPVTVREKRRESGCRLELL